MTEQQPPAVPQDYRFYKKVGILDVFGKTAAKGWRDERNGFELKQGEYFYELQMYDKPEGPLLDQTEQSLHELADVIRKAKHQPKVIMALTYEKLGKLSARKGFREAQLQLPPEIVEDVEESYHRTSPLSKKGLRPGKTMLVYQPTNILLGRY